jgi:hypothetical protein
VLAGIVWKFFERVEAVLKEDTKLEIAVWLLGVKVGPKVQPWPDTFAKVFDRVFGKNDFSWQFFKQCTVVALIMIAIQGCIMLVVYSSSIRVPLLSVGPLVVVIFAPVSS